MHHIKPSLCSAAWSQMPLNLQREDPTERRECWLSKKANWGGRNTSTPHPKGFSYMIARLASDSVKFKYTENWYFTPFTDAKINSILYVKIQWCIFTSVCSIFPSKRIPRYRDLWPIFICCKLNLSIGFWLTSFWKLALLLFYNTWWALKVACCIFDAGWCG